MTHEEYCTIERQLITGSRMILDRIERAARAEEKSEISLETVGEYADIMKDLSEVLKNVTKAHYYNSEPSAKMI